MPDEQMEPTMPNPEAEPGIWARLTARLRTGMQSEPARESKAGERTRALVLLLGATLACLLLFFALFTTDGSESRKERKTKPSLGRPESTDASPEAANRSPIPQLSVNQVPPEESGELTEKDVLGTMRNRGTVVAAAAPKPQAAVRQRTLGEVNFEDPALAEAYRRQGITPPPSPARTEVVASPAPAQPPVVNTSDALRKSSIAFVRSTVPAPPATQPLIERKASALLLPQGTALVARLQHAVSSAAKVPVVAVIEYNSEVDGQLIVPAGSKAYGELAQATPQGWITLKFHALELPNGEREKIDASAISMDRQMLRGYVNGRNSGMKVVTRALTGIGTIAAYAVGGRSANGGIDSSVLLRERLASNVALAGEQQMSTLAYQQNIVVTVPAKTQFYLVFHEPTGVTQAQPQPVLADPEAREVLQLRNEISEMNRLMQQQAQQQPEQR